MRNENEYYNNVGSWWRYIQQQQNTLLHLAIFPEVSLFIYLSISFYFIFSGYMGFFKKKLLLPSSSFFF